MCLYIQCGIKEKNHQNSKETTQNVIWIPLTIAFSGLETNLLNILFTVRMKASFYRTCPELGNPVYALIQFVNGVMHL